jgi:threonine dehydratase
MATTLADIRMVPVALLWERKFDLTGLRVGVILSGGNVDLEKLPW